MGLDTDLDRTTLWDWSGRGIISLSEGHGISINLWETCRGKITIQRHISNACINIYMKPRGRINQLL